MNTELSRIIIVLVCIVGSVILHELAHGVVAYFLGDSTARDAGRLTLNPLRHIDPVMSVIVPVVLYIIGAPVFGGAKPVPVNYRNLKGREWGMALVAIAGPLANFLIAFIAFLIGYYSGHLFDPGFFGFALTELIFINLGFMLFNLIPIPPLDGSRVLYALSPDFVREFLTKIESYGFVIVYLLIFCFGSALSSLMLTGVDGILGFFFFLVGYY